MPLMDCTGYTAYANKEPIYKAKPVSELPSQTETAMAAAPALAPLSIINQKFRSCSVTEHQTAVSLQNALRSILNTHFPVEDVGFHHSQFRLLPEMDSLWRPVFRQSESHRSLRGDKMDLILAIGAQKGVKKEFCSAVMGQVEKLGTKPSGISRSGRLDLRYESLDEHLSKPTRLTCLAPDISSPQLCKHSRRSRSHTRRRTILY